MEFDSNLWEKQGCDTVEGAVARGPAMRRALMTGLLIATTLVAAAEDSSLLEPPRQPSAIHAQPPPKATPPPSLPAPTAAAPVRLPEPTAEGQKRAEEQIRDLFKDEYARRSPADQATLAAKLLQTGIAESGDATARYVLFRESRDAAVLAGAVEDAFRAVDAMAERFDIDGPAVRLTAAEGLAKSARGASAGRALAEEALGLADALAARDDHDRALKALAAAAAGARASGEADLVARVRAEDQSARALQAEFRKAEPALRKLTESPDDPDARLAVGRYVCFAKGDWEAGLRHLAKGGDAALRDLATRELAPPADAAAFLALADGWQKIVATLTGSARERASGRALEHYRAALPGLAAAEAERVRKRIAELEKAAGGPGAAAVPPGAVLRLSFDKATLVAKGGKRFARDLSGNGFDAELFEGRTEPGVVGDCLHLDGGHAIVPTGKILDLGVRTGAFTIACWVRFDKAFGSEAMLFEHAVFGDAASWQLTFMDCRTPRINFPALHAKEKPVDGACSFKPGEWHHLAGTYDGKLGQLFTDGQRIAEQKVSLPLPAGEAPSYIGSRGGRGLLLPGSLDELLVYPRVLKDAEIRALAGAGRRGATAK
jgi:hypothetical protein